MSKPVTALLLVILALGSLAPRGAAQMPPASPAGSQDQTTGLFFCPMHPDVTSRTAGTCPKCGMALVAGDPWNEREYVVDMQVTPPAPRAGAPVTLRFAVKDPATRAVVRDFALVHDKRFHLFVVSQDLEHLAHIHPEQQADGSWSIEHVLPVAGYYRIYSDFLPQGGTPQVIADTLVTAGFTGDLARSVPRLTPDTTLEKVADGTTVRLRIEPDTIVAGRMVKLRYYLEANGRPVQDLEPYLAAWGHTLVLSEDALEYVHAHPIEYLPPERPDIKGGPEITFDALFPRPGRYRVWTQFKRGDHVSTTWFTVEAVPAPSL